jgi:dihydrofolate reductase
MKAIVAVDQKWAIGKDGGLLVRLPGDMKNFRRLTTGNVVIMGRKTLESMPGGKPLPDRETWVLTRNEAYEAPCRVFRDIRSLLDEVRTLEDEYGGEGYAVYVCGGANVYAQLLPYCDEALVTKIGATFPADSWFPDLDMNPDWELVNESEPLEDGGIRYRFCTYRKTVLPSA